MKMGNASESCLRDPAEESQLSWSCDQWRRCGQSSRNVRLGSHVLGFTLIEVLAALVIVSLGMLGVIQAVSQTASNSTYLRDKTIAHWVAMNRLTEVRLQSQAPKVDKSSDEVEMAGQRWRWTMNVTQTDVESIRRIDIGVRPAEADEDSSMAFITGFYGAALAPPGSTLVMWQGVERGGPGSRDRDQADRGDRRESSPPPVPELPKEQPEPAEPPPVPESPQ
jgi:general secretion pathway protein I